MKTAGLIRPGSRLSAALAVLTIASPVLLIVISFAVWASMEYAHQGARQNDERRLAHRHRSMTTQLAAYQSLRTVWEGYAQSPGAGLLPGATLEEAEAAFSSKTAEVLTRYGGAWVGAERLPMRTERYLTELRAEARGVLPERALAPFLEALEREEPFIFIDAVDIRRIDDAPGGAADTRLDLRLRLSAYRLAERAP